MATHNVEDGSGGLDGSIQYEMGRPENAGDNFFNTLRFLTLEINRYVSGTYSLRDVAANADPVHC